MFAPAAGRGGGGDGTASHRELVERLYGAETIRDGLYSLLRLPPRWVPPVALASTLFLYGGVLTIRLKYVRWRLKEQSRAQRRYELLENLRGIHAISGTGSGGRKDGAGGQRVHALQEDEDDEEEGDTADDKASVSLRDVDEFRSSLGILLPRDEDLLAMIEQILVDAPIPEGWELYRTTAGIIRFINRSTQELSFFHPGVQTMQEYIEGEIRRRNREAMENKYATQTGGTASGRSAAGSAPRSSGLLEKGGMSELKGEPPGTTFGAKAEGSPSPIELFNPSHPPGVVKRMLNYFLEREQRRIYQNVADAHAKGSALSSFSYAEESDSGESTSETGREASSEVMSDEEEESESENGQSPLALWDFSPSPLSSEGANVGVMSSGLPYTAGFNEPQGTSPFF